MDIESEIRDPEAAEAGRRRIEWAWGEMPVLRQIHARFAETRPLDGVPIDTLTDAQRAYPSSWREGT